VNYDIFIDESGLFTETSRDPGDRIIEHKRRKKFASQLAGFIALEGRCTTENALKNFKLALDEVSLTINGEYHSTHIKSLSDRRFDRLVISICSRFTSASIQPFRLVNRERVSFGNRKDNYVNMLAELLIRICKELDREDQGAILLNVYQAGVKIIDFESGDNSFWKREDFAPTLQTAFQRASISAGWASDSSKWKLGTIQFKSGTKDARLWFCDLISNASHDDFRTIDDEASKCLKNALGEFDFSLSFNSTLRKVAELSSCKYHAIALILLLEAMFCRWTGAEAKAAYKAAFFNAFKDMLKLQPSARTSQVEMIHSWLVQIADDRDRLDDVKGICKWVDSRVLANYKLHIDDTDSSLIAWLRLRLATTSLTACNHSADLSRGMESLLLIDSLMPQIAGRWEYVSDLMRAFVAQAVHLNDRFEHEEARVKMNLVITYYRGLGDLFNFAYPSVFPNIIKSRVCGEAIGTMIQTQIFQLPNGMSSIDEARKNCELAAEQFSDESDKSRIFQYRSEIESIAGDWEAARRFLAIGINSHSRDHNSLANRISELALNSQAFPLLHWTRIGGMAALADMKAEVTSFLAAWNTTDFDELIGNKKLPTYPAHGILRRMTAVFAYNNEFEKMTKAMRSLTKLVKANPQPLFMLIEAACILQAAGIVGRLDTSKMRQIIYDGKKKAPVGDLLYKVVRETSPKTPVLSKIASACLEAIQKNPTPLDLIRVAQVVGY
jgi:hypothetical protein